MSLGRLKWLTIILPIIFMAALQACLMLFLEPNLGSTLGLWVALGVVAAAAVAFSTIVFRVLNGMQRAQPSVELLCRQFLLEPFQALFPDGRHHIRVLIYAYKRRVKSNR